MKRNKKVEHHRIRTKPVSGKPDLSDWTLETFDRIRAAIEPAIQQAAAEAIGIALESEGTYASWPAEWGESDGNDGDAVTDPLTIYLTVDLAGGVESPIRSFSLRDALKFSIAATREDGSYAEGLARIRDALRSLAGEIDRALAPTTTKKR